MSPASAASTALRVDRRASPSNKVAAANVAVVFLEPRRRPAGLHDCPDWNSRPRPRAGGRGTTSSLIESLSQVAYVLLYTQYGIASMAITRPWPQ
jgi:hypothetical protein